MPERGWLDLRRMAEYTCLSVRTLRRYIGDPLRPLPVRLVGGKWLARISNLDEWLKSFPQADADLDRLVNEVLEDLRDG